ncbi:Lin1244/Lin1753 domain-containing protein [Senegalia massiliensis]|uniref:DUF4373 domain-containing protein n=1 Tax=Senegalia massiliensis TaxID=1720316 RepID=A0A845QZ77_9CLOT|nr:Lin1244/Lin1753 domain-containing protein [Senegalia massiliensis]NBI08257.1 DUF4373 domain-containing protein [Senegalia massiliensis]
MARPIKTGLDYYPLDVDFLQDIKIRKIMRACGIQSITILISLLSSIYRDKGYYVVWDNDMTFLVADEVGASEGAVIEVVNKAVQVDFFNEYTFKQYKILTSKGIQKRFLEAISRRKEINLISEYLLIDLDNDYSNLVNVNINSINDNRSTQSKEKKSKVKKSKEYNNKKNDDCCDGFDNDLLDEEDINLDDNEFKKLSTMYQQILGQANSYTKDWIVSNLEDFGYEWLSNAMFIAEKNGKRTKAYVEGILKNWKANGGMDLEGKKKPQQQKKESKPNNFHNFKQRTKKYSADELEDKVRRKFERKINGG